MEGRRKITLAHIIFGHHPFSESDRMLHLKLFCREIYLCARCTGQYVGLLIYILLSIQQQIKPHFSCLLIWSLPFPATYDWLTQTLNMCKSTISIRLITGCLFGLWLGIFFHIIILFDFDAMFIVGIQVIVYVLIVLSILMINQGSIDQYLKPSEDFIESYLKQKS
jgi:uncharacterized membrane protein